MIIGLLLVTLLTFAVPVSAQEEDRVLQSNAPSLSIRDGGTLSANGWRLAPELDPDIYEARLRNGQPHRVTFLSDVDSISFMVEEGREYDFVVMRNGVRHPTRIIGRRFTPAARFDAAYQDRWRGTTRIHVPEVYELVNVAIALTEPARRDRGLVYEWSPYRERVRDWFGPHRRHRAVMMLDSALARNANSYFTLKMNGYAFEFDESGRIVKSAVYDRTGFGGEASNSLEPFVAALEDFARESDFRSFYRRNRETYDAQIAFYRDSANVPAMLRWLEGNFPGQRPYDAFNIVFSPLVGHNQSVTWFDEDGFKELQPHINFPYGAIDSMSHAASTLYRGNIMFTELNHGFINPEADAYAERIAGAIDNRNFWVDSTRGPGYYGGNAAFNEYMNWALVGLHFADRAPAADLPLMLRRLDTYMQRRGFPQFPALMRFLVPLYVDRPEGTTLADLYPQIIDWFDRTNRASKAGP